MKITNLISKNKKGSNTKPNPKQDPKADLPVKNGDQTNGETNYKTLITDVKPVIKNPNIDRFQKKMHVVDLVAPQFMETDFDHLKIGDTYLRTIFVSGYPRFVVPGWLEPVINFNSSLDITFYIYPVEGKSVLDDLRRKITEMEAEIATDLERGKVVDPGTQAKLEDARALQDV